MLKRLFGAGLAALAGVAFTAGASAQTLDKIKSRGVLVVGTKADYKPFGFRDPSGAIVASSPTSARRSPTSSASSSSSSRWCPRTACSSCSRARST